MPYMNGTGPLGKGRRTGRGLGPCRDTQEETLHQRAKNLRKQLEIIEAQIKEKEL